MIKIIAVGGLAASLLAIPAPASAATEPPANVNVEVVAANGSGCTDQKATAITSEDGSSFTILFGGYYVTAGDGSSVLDGRRNCQFTVQVDAPEGYTYAVASAGYGGRYDLDEGVSAYLSANYYFQGSSETLAFDRTYAGPRSGRWSTGGGIAEKDRVFAPCDAERNLNINTSLRVASTTDTAPADTNYITMSPTFPVELVWARC